MHFLHSFAPLYQTQSPRNDLQEFIQIFMVVSLLYIVTHIIILRRSWLLRYEFESKKVTAFGLFIITGPLAIGAVASGIQGIWNEYQLYQSVKTKAIITELKFSESDVGPRCHVLVEYAVETITYTHRERFYCKQSKYTVQKVIPIYYAPHNPERAIIAKNDERLDYIMACFVGLFSWFAIYLTTVIKD